LTLALAASACTNDSKAGGCPALTKPKSGGTDHPNDGGEGTKSVWKAEDSPHRVGTFSLFDAELTIEPCSYVIMDGGGTSITVSRGGKLTAVGTEDQPIAIDAADPSKPWETIETRYITPTGYTEDTQGGYIQMAHVTMSDGGVTYTGSLVPMMRAHGADSSVTNLPPTEHLDLQDVTVQRGSTYGVLLDLGATFSPTSKNLTITDQPTAPMRIGFRNIDAVPTGKYTGNGHDVIEVDPDVTGLIRSATVHPRDVPYLMGLQDDNGHFAVGLDTGAAGTLTIEPGVTMQFRPHNPLEIYKTGTLVARGTAADPIVFTSGEATPAAGDWSGIQFIDVPSAASVIDHAVVEYAGDNYQSLGATCNVSASGGSSSYGAIAFAERPATALVTNTLIAHSLHNGIDRVWTGSPLDFTPTNTFTDNAECKQSYPVPSTGACPDPVPCD